MKFLISFVVLFVMNSLSFAATEPFVEKGFKTAESTVIDILRLKNPTLDSRYVVFESEDQSGGFAICCYKKKNMTAKYSKDDSILGKFLVTVGNTNYQNYEKGIVQTSIVTESLTPYVQPLWRCEEHVDNIIKDLFPVTAAVEKHKDKPETYAAAYMFEVKDNGVVIGQIILNAAECKLQSVILNPQTQQIGF